MFLNCEDAMHPLKLLLNIYNIFHIYIYIYIYRPVNNQSYKMLDRQKYEDTAQINIYIFIYRYIYA